jgi:hypothetical protein
LHLVALTQISGGKLERNYCLVPGISRWKRFVSFKRRLNKNNRISCIFIIAACGFTRITWSFALLSTTFNRILKLIGLAELYDATEANNAGHRMKYRFIIDKGKGEMYIRLNESTSLYAFTITYITT